MTNPGPETFSRLQLIPQLISHEAIPEYCIVRAKLARLGTGYLRIWSNRKQEILNVLK